MGVVLREQTEGDGGDRVVAPALVQAQEQVTALLLAERWQLVTFDKNRYREPTHH